MFTICRHTCILFVSAFLVVTLMLTTAIPMPVPSTTITAKDAEGTMYLLVTNSSRETSYNVHADLSALITSGTGTMWQFDATHNDVIVGHPTLSNGHVTFTIPSMAAVLITFETPVEEQTM
jgi:hypothetical protein